jgi:GSH-dependent disulfide-bond oxidoreductase
MLELHHGEPNTFALMPLIALYEKGLDFKSRYHDPVDFDAVPENEEAAFGLDGEGPVLIHDGKIISEAFFASLYLDEAFPAKPLRPEDALGRWRVLAWARFVGEVMAPAVATLGCKTYLAPALADRDKAALEKKAATLPTEERQAGWRAAIENDYSDETLEDSGRKVALAVGRIEETLAGGDFILGDHFSLADINTYAVARCLPTLTPGLVNPKASPKTWAWLERVGRRPSVKSALSLSRTNAPEMAFAPGPEHSRWG